MSSPTFHGTRDFARHETFHPRYGWLKKGFDHAKEDPTTFTREDATTVLGVGKNMVRAIRYWCLAYKVLEERPGAGRVREVQPTVFGDALLSEGGWDPYLEEPGSLWLLHWRLLQPPCRAPAWWAIFNRSVGDQFTDETLLGDLRRFRDQHEQFADIVDGSLLKDAKCLLRMYRDPPDAVELLEDSMDSPFSDLELIRRTGGRGKSSWRLNTKEKPRLPDEVIAAACLEFAGLTAQGARVLGVAGLTRHDGSPGRAFALAETSVGDALHRHAMLKDSPIVMTNAAGVRQLQVPVEPAVAANQILNRFYARQGRGV